MMLALTESDTRKHAGDRKRQKGSKKSRSGKQKRTAMLSIDKDELVVEAKEELQIHELMPVPYKPEEHHQHMLSQAEVTFEDHQADGTVISQADCQSVATISCMDSVQNSNKFVIITLLEPQAQGMATGQLLDKDKKVILLHKIDDQGTATLEASTETEDPLAKVDGKAEYESPLMTINFSDFAATTTTTEDNQEQRVDINEWIKNYDSMSLLYTESGKPYVKCPACTAMYFKVSSFEKHVSCHLRKEEERYVCNFCKFEHDDANTIFGHLVVHQDQCEVCNMNLTRKNSFKKHWEFSEMTMTCTIKRDRWGRFLCIYCKLGFDLQHQLQKHWFKHSCVTRKTSQCNNCTGLFDNDQALQNHVCLKCPVCGKICDSVHRLRSHTRYEKHYLYCPICTYEFILAVDHEKHMALHKKMYQVHKDYVHCLESEDGTSFQCEICGKIYHTMSGLVLHIHDDHKIPEASQVNDEELARISLPEGKEDVVAEYDIIGSLKGELKCEVDFQRACEEVLEAQTERTVVKVDGSKVNEGGDEQCEPVALCWVRARCSVLE